VAQRDALVIKLEKIIQLLKESDVAFVEPFWPKPRSGWQVRGTNSLPSGRPLNADDRGEFNL